MLHEEEQQMERVPEGVASTSAGAGGGGTTILFAVFEILKRKSKTSLIICLTRCAHCRMRYGTDARRWEAWVEMA